MKKYLKLLIPLFIFIGIFLFIGNSKTQAATIEELTAQIQVLLNQIQQLQNQITELRGQKPAPVPIPPGIFVRNLAVGSRGDDVRALQQFLKDQGSGIYPEGLVTGYFGSATQRALANYQIKAGIYPAEGYFGPKTRNFISSGGGVPLLSGVGSSANLPDLTIISVTIDEPRDNYYLKDNIKIIIKAKNIGLGDSQGFNIIITNQNNDWTSRNLLEQSIYGKYGIRAGEEITIPMSLDLAMSGLVGINIYEFRIDVGNRVTEINEFNNHMTLRVDITNRPPAISSISGPTSLQINQSSTWTVNATDPEGKALQYQVNWGDGTATTAKQTSANFTHTYTQAKTYTLTFTAYDDQGLSTSKTYTVTVTSTTNQPPVISSVSGPTTLSVNQSGSWTVNATDPEGKSLTYQVNWGDGTATTAKQTPASFTHTFTTAKTYTLTFSAHDDQGLYASKTHTVTVSSGTTNLPDLIVKSVTLDPQKSVYAKTDSVQMSITVKNIGTASPNSTSCHQVRNKTNNWLSASCNFRWPFEPNGEDATNITWNFVDTVVDGLNEIEVMVDPWNHIAESNENNNTYTFTIQVGTSTTNQPPTISSISGPTSLQVNQSGSWTVNATDPEGKSLTYRVNWGDGTATTAKQTPASFTHTFTTAKTYTLTFSAHDDQGLYASKTHIVTVSSGTTNQPPVITNLSGPSSLGVNINGTWKLTISDPENSSLALKIDWGDGTSYSKTFTYSDWYMSSVRPFAFDHAYANIGTFTPRFTITDDKNQSVSQAAPTVTITQTSVNRPPVIDEVTGPASVNGLQNPTWNIKAHDPEGGLLSYGIQVPGVLDTGGYVCFYISTYPNSCIPSWNTPYNSIYVTVGNPINPSGAPGNFTATFSVEDNQGARATKSLPLKIQKAAPPVISQVNPLKATVNQQTTWTITASDSDGGAIAYSVAWGDGTTSPKQSSPSFAHTYAKTGTYNAVFTAYDEEGPDKGLSSSKTFAITVLPPCISDASLVLYYPLDEGSGGSGTKINNLSCLTSNINDGTIAYIYGAAPNSTAWVEDEGRTALKFIGGGYVKTPDHSTLDVSTEFTIDVWVKINQFKHLYSTILKKDGAYGLRFSGSPTAKLHGWFINASNGQLVEIYSQKTDWTLNKWYRLSFTYDGTNLKLYMDGALDSLKAYSGAVMNSNGELRLGTGTSGSAEWLVGLINDIKIYNKAVSIAAVPSPYISGGISTGLTASVLETFQSQIKEILEKIKSISEQLQQL